MSERPLHTDEAVHAVKFAELLENNAYQYDPHEYHGPTLNYLTLIPAWLRGQTRFADLDERTIRIVPVLFGLFMLPLLLGFRHGMDRVALVSSALLLAVSPAFVFYSRYYIQEVLFVCFNLFVLIAAHRFLLTRKTVWAILTGVGLGLMHATKETCILPWWTMSMALLLTLLWQLFNPVRNDIPIPKPGIKQLLILLASAVLTSMLFFSSFGFNVQGIVDSIRTYTTYLKRAGGHDWHIHPWYRYFQWMLFYKASGLQLWSEGFIFLTALFSLRGLKKDVHVPGYNKNLLRFLIVHTFLLTLIYSLIPYKTPWSFLGAWLGWVILSGAGISLLYHWVKQKFARAVLLTFLIAGVLHLSYQSYLLNFTYEDHPGNPYTYSQPRDDVKQIALAVAEVAEASSTGQDTYIDVICTGADYWPLPWYLRSFSTIGWWSDVRMDLPAAPIILACPRIESELIKKLYELPPPGEKHLYLPLYDDYLELRPKVELRGYVRKDYWDAYQNNAQPAYGNIK